MKLKNSKSYVERLTWVDFRSGWTLSWGHGQLIFFGKLPKKMDFPHVLIPKESPAATPINWLSTNFAILNMVAKSQ